MTAPKILIYDIETTPIQGWTWGMYDTNVIEVIEPSHHLCFAYKWYGETETQVVSQRQFSRGYKRNKRDDRQVVGALHALMDEADIVIAHNGNSFDQKKANARFAVHGLPKPSPYLQIDTLRICRKEFKLESNKLDSLGDVFNLGRKVQTGGFKLWTGCMAGDDDAWQKMEDYNVQDVDLLEGVYEYLRDGGWITNHPNLALMTGDRHACPKCGSHDMMKRGPRYTATAVKQTYQCNDCNSYSSERTAKTGPRYA